MKFSTSVKWLFISLTFLNLATYASNNTDSLELKKNVLDKFFHKAASLNKKQISVWAKVKGKAAAIRIQNGKWPDNIEYSYNIIKDPTSHTTLMLASPYSESGDWDIDYIYYFDADEKLFSFERRTDFFNSECTDGAAHEKIINYYNSEFKMLKKEYLLIDDKNKKLVRLKCSFPFEFKDYKIYRNLNDCLKAYKINIR